MLPKEFAALEAAVKTNDRATARHLLTTADCYDQRYLLAWSGDTFDGPTSAALIIVQEYGDSDNHPIAREACAWAAPLVQAVYDARLDSLADAVLARGVPAHIFDEDDPEDDDEE